MIQTTEKITDIGASTGGTEALRVLLEGTGGDFPRTPPAWSLELLRNNKDWQDTASCHNYGTQVSESFG